MSNTKTIKLRIPITAEGREITEVTCHRIQTKTVLAIRKIHKDDDSREVAIIAQVLGLPPEAVEELDIADYNTVKAEIGEDFL